MLAVVLFVAGFAPQLPPTAVSRAPLNGIRFAVMSEEPATPETGPSASLVDQMIARGPGKALLFHYDDMKEAYAAVAGDWDDTYISSEQLDQLMGNVGACISSHFSCRLSSLTTSFAAPAGGGASGIEVLSAIERDQEITQRDGDGNARIYFEQWAKYMNDMVREKVTGSREAGGFKWPF
jgi:hypothetical protein